MIPKKKKTLVSKGKFCLVWFVVCHLYGGRGGTWRKCWLFDNRGSVKRDVGVK